LEAHLGWAANRLGFLAETPVFDGAKESEIEAELARAWLIDRAWQVIPSEAWAHMRSTGMAGDDLVDDADARFIYLATSGWNLWATMRKNCSTISTMPASLCLREWLRERGYDPDNVVPALHARRVPPARANEFTNDVALREWMIYHGGNPGDLSWPRIGKSRPGTQQRSSGRCLPRASRSSTTARPATPTTRR
jgi:DNA-directed RNA polymerase subunit beta